MTCDALIFDLDGTLWDAAAASTLGWNRALEQFGLPQRVTEDGIRSVSGNPFARCVEILLPELHPATADLLHALEDKEREGIEAIAGELYDGVAVGLRRLATRYPLFIVSNCPDWYLERFLDFSGLGAHFSGSDCHGSSGLGKPFMLRATRIRSRLTRPLYIGDTQGDCDAAAEAGVAFGYAAYGFGRVDGASLCFADFSELVRHFLDGREQ